MENNKPKEGVSLKEIEQFAKKHRFEVFFALLFILACFFSFIMWGTGLAVSLAALGAILGVLFPGKVEFFSKKGMEFVFKQEDTTQIILGVVALIIAIFLPPLIFLKLGVHGGKDIYHRSVEIYSHLKK